MLECLCNLLILSLPSLPFPSFPFLTRNGEKERKGDKGWRFASSPASFTWREPSPGALSWWLPHHLLAPSGQAGCPPEPGGNQTVEGAARRGPGSQGRGRLPLGLLPSHLPFRVRTSGFRVYSCEFSRTEGARSRQACPAGLCRASTRPGPSRGCEVGGWAISGSNGAACAKVRAQDASAVSVQVF
jgi:hypothetical protein